MGREGGPDFTDEDRLYALALDRIEQRQCPGCGGDLAETAHPDNEDAYDGQVFRCFKCRATRDVMAEHSKAGTSSGLYGYAVSDPNVTTT